jgi:hypothetical protein
MMTEETVYKAERKEAVRRRSAWPALLVGAGILLLGPTLLPERFWLPLMLLIGPGLLLLWPSYRSTRGAVSQLSFLAIPGAILLLLGGLVLITGFTYHYGSWAYAWVLLPAAGVAGAMYMKRFEPEHPIHTTGYRVLRAFILAFMGLALLFELFFFRGMGAWWPVMLIALGLYLWLRDKRS